ncbi:hypothetical protein [Burkholderia ambifaria]|uniref:hypothetical protein n=1 Tax=Burkholderia ambifaria TaxID=152480 RepID=UPI001FC87D64|nr:hypothetical protein [Burkholderia ambifaria]WDR87927.1 hypothetical protein OR986_04850 [Burkholderia ambifaria]WDS00655.1 hypothetical protein OR985_09800 [Burkholderia ambifaria]
MIDVSGDVSNTLFWYRNERLPPFDYKMAEELMAERRFDDILRYVVSPKAGVAG